MLILLGFGQPPAERLLRLPAFLTMDDDTAPERISRDDIADGFRLTGFFLVRYVLEPRGLALSDARESFVVAVLRDRNAVVVG